MREKDGPISNQWSSSGGDWSMARQPCCAQAIARGVWTEAVGVAGEKGSTERRGVASDYANLKRESRRQTQANKRTGTSEQDRPRVKGEGSSDGEERDCATEFVELLAGSIAADCVIEVEGSGGKMRIQMKLTAPEVVSWFGSGGRAIMIHSHRR